MTNRLHPILQSPLILPLYLPSLIFAFCLGLIVPVLPLYAAEFGVSYGLIGLFLAGESLGKLLGGLPAVMFLRHLGEKKAMLLSLGGTTLAMLALFWAHSIAEAFLYYLLAGFGVALFNLARHAYLADTVTLAGRGQAIAMYGGINRIGRFAGPALGGMIAAIYGLRAPFLLFGAACGIALIIIVIFVRATHSDLIEKLPTPKSYARHLWSTLTAHHKVLTTAGTGQLFAQMIRAARPVIIPLYAADVLGLDVGAIGWILTVATAVDMSLFYPAGLIMDRWGRKYAIVPCFLIQVIGMALIPFTWSFGSLLAVSTLIGFGNGLGSGTMMTLGADLAPPDSRSEFLGVWRLVGDVGMSGAPLIAGIVADLLVLQMAAWVMAGAGLIAVLTFALLVPETLDIRRIRTILNQPTQAS